MRPPALTALTALTTLTALTAVPLPLVAQSAADSAAVRATALDYIEGWYTGDSVRMARAVHPELAKRIVFRDGGRELLRDMGATELVAGTARGAGSETPPAEQRTDVRILDMYEHAASVRVDAGAWIDYLHLARWHGRWVIVNVLWELRPRP